MKLNWSYKKAYGQFAAACHDYFCCAVRNCGSNSNFRFVQMDPFGKSAATKGCEEGILICNPKDPSDG